MFLIDRPSGAARKRLDLAHVPNFDVGPARIYPARREVQFGDRSQTIEPLAMRVLVVLARADGEVVSRNDLIDQCWGGRIVTEDAVTRVLSQLRRTGGNAFTIETIRSVGCRLIAAGRDGAPRTDQAKNGAVADPGSVQQRIAFCRTEDGTTLAYSRLGEGPPLVKVPNWHGHLEHEIENPIWHHWIEELSSRNELLRYDQRGTGMSDWTVPELTFDLLVNDLTTVVDAAGIERFDLLAISQGTPVAVTFAARYPERVRKLVLINSFASGWRHSPDPDHVESWEAMCTLVRTGWGTDTPALRQVFTSQMLPDGTLEQWDWSNNFQKRSASAENAHRILQMFGSVDASEMLAEVQAPTLVMHCKGDQLVLPERGRFIASKIPGAQFVALDGRNHLPQPKDESWGQIKEALRRFLH